MNETLYADTQPPASLPVNAANPTAMQSDNFWSDVWGAAAPSTLYFGMFSTHLKPQDNNSANWHNDLFGGVYNGFFAGTLINSWGTRAYAAGIQRCWLTRSLSDNVRGSLGYRLGIISGYDERFDKIAEYTPVLPFPQIIYDLSWKQAGIELGYSWVDVSVGLFVRF